MATVNVQEAHTHSLEEAVQRVKSFEEQLTKFMVQVEWSDSSATLKGPVSGGIEVDDASVSITIKLGMMAKMAGIDAGRLEGSIRKRLRESLDS